MGLCPPYQDGVYVGKKGDKGYCYRQPADYLFNHNRLSREWTLITAN